MSPALSELEEALWEFEASGSGPPQYTDEGVRASIKIFMFARACPFVLQIMFNRYAYSGLCNHTTPHPGCKMNRRDDTRMWRCWQMCR